MLGLAATLLVVGTGFLAAFPKIVWPPPTREAPSLW
jgi:hypothetical protein